MPPVYRKLVLLAWLATGCDSPNDTGETGDGVARGALSFGFPLATRATMDPPVIGFDHDPEVHEGIYQAYCTDYMGRGFPHCYDEHDGSDFMLDGGFEAMDAGSETIVAAAPGTVLDTDDGHYDRCHADLGSQDVDCDGHPMQANYVILEHEGGWRTLYWHMKTDSVAVQPGQQVERGAALGLVGSSGYSSAPHLHFELQGPDGEAIDPYAGEHSQPETWWCEQGDPDDFPGDCD
jgi:murein DD-endopeptidase MepM/ murein hydrolase activator NlpD